jgi:hypothetical protein
MGKYGLFSDEKKLLQPPLLVTLSGRKVKKKMRITGKKGQGSKRLAPLLRMRLFFAAGEN